VRGRERRLALDPLRAAGARQVDEEGAARALLALDVDRPAMRGDDAMRHREAQPRALPHRFRREERLEDARARLGVHAAAIVAHREARVASRRQRRGDRPRARGVELDAFQPDLDAPRAALERMPGVRAQVHQHLLDLRRVREHVQRPFGHP
jgi:hypothetical protein